MRKAATKAGLVESESSERLQLALEPEAACIACEHESANLQKDDVFILVDAGGGTVDLTISKVAAKHPSLLLEELAAPSGGPFGSTFVDSAFEEILKDLVGEAAFLQFKPSPEWIQLMRTWESTKLGFTGDQRDGDSLGPSESQKHINISPILEVRIIVPLAPLLYFMA